jgi:hypothetical protein
MGASVRRARRSPNISQLPEANSSNSSNSPRTSFCSHPSASAIRNLIERHLLVHATTVGACLERHAVRTNHKGWLWGSTVRELPQKRPVAREHSAAIEPHP